MPAPNSDAAKEQVSTPESISGSAREDQRPPFRWSEIESSDYRQYINNLRVVGCPEQTIRDLIQGEFNGLYAARARAIWNPPGRAYWQKSRNESPNPAQVKQLMALEGEKAGQIKELLGFRPSHQALIDTVFLQLHGDEQQLLFLPEEKRQAALQAFAEADFEQKEAVLRSENPNTDVERTMFNDKLKALAQVLSPEQLNEFRLRSAPRASWLRNEVQFLNCTVDEFQALLELREQRLGSKEDMVPDRATALEDVRKVLGEERAKEFERVSDPNYLNARYAADRAGLPAELGDRAAQLTLDAVAAGTRLAKDASLSADERQRRLQALQSQTEGQLNEVLGEKAAAGVRRTLRRSLSMTAQNIRP